MNRSTLALLALQGIIWLGPRLTPQEAAAILAASPGRSNIASLVSSSVHPPIAVTGSQPVTPVVVGPALRPLNCCSTYVHVAPHPLIDVRILNAR